MNKRLTLTLESLTISFLLLIPSLQAHATPFSPANTLGIEFSDLSDRNAMGVPDSEQNVNTNGTGATANGLDFSNSRATDDNDRQVDALANSGDAYYNDVTNNSADLLFSVSGDTDAYFHSVTGNSGTWAIPSMFDSSIGITDLDGLEVWGPSFPQSDAWRYSVERDEATNEVGDFVGDFVSVWEYDMGTGESSALFTVEDIANAINLDSFYQAFLDVDAMMSFGNEIMFSLAPIDAVLDGGEIWVWDGVDGNLANFLIHGGNIWDTSFDITGTFGINSENINALEAVPTARPVPEPGTIFLMGLGIIGICTFMLRRQTKSVL